MYFLYSIYFYLLSIYFEKKNQKRKKIYEKLITKKNSVFKCLFAIICIKYRERKEKKNTRNVLLWFCNAIFLYCNFYVFFSSVGWFFIAWNLYQSIIFIFTFLLPMVFIVIVNSNGNNLWKFISHWFHCCVFLCFSICNNNFFFFLQSRLYCFSNIVSMEVVVEQKRKRKKILYVGVLRNVECKPMALLLAFELYHLH